MLTVLKNIEEKLQNAGGADKAGSSVYVSKIVENLIQLNTMLEAATRVHLFHLSPPNLLGRHHQTILQRQEHNHHANQLFIWRKIQWSHALTNYRTRPDQYPQTTRFHEDFWNNQRDTRDHYQNERLNENVTLLFRNSRLNLDLLLRLAASMTNLILRNVAEIEYFPGGAINEIFQTVSKVNKGASEAGLKMVTLSAIRYLIKQKLMMSTSNVAEIFKIIQRSVSVAIFALVLIKMIDWYIGKSRGAEDCRLQDLEKLLKDHPVRGVL